MNSGVVGLDQIMPILLTMNKHCLQLLLLRLTRTVNNISESGMWIQANQSNLFTCKNSPISQRWTKHMWQKSQKHIQLL